MAKRKPITIDGDVRIVDTEQKLRDILPREVGSIVTHDGALITREQFDRVPIPEGFDTNLSTINKGQEGHDAAAAATQSGACGQEGL